MHCISFAIRRCVLAFAVVLLGCVPGIAWAQTLYGMTILGELITINPVTGAGTLVATTTAPVGAGMAFRGPKLYVYQTGGTLTEIDATTGATISTIKLPILTPLAGGDIRFRADGIGFYSPATSFGQFWSFDITVPTATPITPPMVFKGQGGIAFNAAGTLYGFHSVLFTLNTVDTATGALTLIGNTGIPFVNASQSLDFDATGKLFGIVTPIGGPGTLYTFDVVTGLATVVGPIGFNDVCDIAFGVAPLPPPPPPAPIPGGGTLEGNYSGSKGLANGNGYEGTFGFGRQLRTVQPFLKGPHRDPLGSHRVFNVAHQRPAQAADDDSGLGAVGWGLLSLAVLAPAALVFGRRRPA